MEVITLNQEAFSERCDELISKIDFKPQIVVGVLNGGGFVMREIKNNLGSDNFETVYYQRHSKLKKHKGVELLLELFPYKFTNWLRVLESIKAKKSIKMLDLIEISKQEIDLKFSTTFENKIRTILIVDDAIDTGKTMFVVKNNLMKLFPKAQIKIAVLAWTLEDSIVQPNFFIFKNILVRFPWSKDYKGKDRF